MWFNEETGKWEKFGTSPVSDAYFMFVDENIDEQIKNTFIKTSYRPERLNPETTSKDCMQIFLERSKFNLEIIKAQLGSSGCDSLNSMET